MCDFPQMFEGHTFLLEGVDLRVGETERFNLGRLDLYEATFDGKTTPRLAVILEYFANLMLGNTQHPCGGSWSYDYLGQYDRFDNYEVAYNHYINRLNANYLPVFAEMVEDFWRNDVGADAHFLLWSRLTHGDNTYAPMPPPDRATEPPRPVHNGPAYWIKVDARRDGSFTVTNSRNGFTKSY